MATHHAHSLVFLGTDEIGVHGRANYLRDTSSKARLIELKFT